MVVAKLKLKANAAKKLGRLLTQKLELV